jgi:alanine racemase
MSEAERAPEVGARATRLEVDFERLAHNLNKLRERCKVPIMGMVKALGYGAGVDLAIELDRLGIDALGVAYPVEGFQLRANGVTCPVLVLCAEQEAYPRMLELNLEPSIFRLDQIESWAAASAQARAGTGAAEIPVHLKVETGMRRMGLPAEHWGEAGRTCQKFGLTIGSVFSHLSAADIPVKDPHTLKQIQAYKRACVVIGGTAGAGPNTFKRHLANTAAAGRFPQARLDMVRIGVGLHGLDPSGAWKCLQPISKLLTCISQVQDVPAKAPVSYNADDSSTADRNRRIAMLPVGYADGYPRSLGNGCGETVIAGQRCPTVGPVCMDFTLVDVTDCPKVQPGEGVELFGDTYSVADFAQAAGTIPYEVLCGVQQRVRRVYSS